MSRIKTFEQYNTPEGEMIKEEFLDGIQTKIKNFLQDPTEEVANKLLQQTFVFTFNNSLTKHYKDIAHKLSLKEKTKLLEDALDKLQYSSINALRLVKSKTSDKLTVGSIKRKPKEQPVQY